MSRAAAQSVIFLSFLQYLFVMLPFVSLHSILGMGYLNSVCDDSWAVSTTEENYNAVTIHIAAHELGHK